jgi:hypothetical protein
LRETKRKFEETRRETEKEIGKSVKKHGGRDERDRGKTPKNQ